MSELTKPHKDYEAMLSRWELCEHFSEGEHAVHDKREVYLPRLTQESDTSYDLRLKMTPVFGAMWRTIAGLRGMLFRKPPKFELPAVLVDLLGNIDGAGTTMLGLAQEVAEEALTVGRVGLLVDYPTAPDGITRADALALKLRPLISLYEAESAYNWFETTDNGAKVLTQVRLKEEARMRSTDDEFAVKCEERYRILDIFNGAYRQRLYHKNEKGEEVQIGGDVFPKMNNAPMTFIPFVFIGVDCVGPDVGAPPLVDLATTCLHHYLQATSYERGCFFSGLPTMFISGMEKDDGDIAIGGSVANSLGNPNAKAYYVEVESKFEALRQNLEDKKAEMAVLGARMLSAARPGVEAAETLARRQSGEEAILSTMAQTASQGLTQAMQWMADFLGASGKVSYELNRDFLPASMTAQDLTALVGAWQNGAISAETLFLNLKQGEVIADDTTFEIEQERISSAQMKLAQQQDQQSASDAQMQMDLAAKLVAMAPP